MNRPTSPQIDLSIEFGFADDFQLQAALCVTGVTGIQGPSGCGKSTLFKLIAGLLRPETGFIKTDRTLFDVQAKIDLPAQHRNIGFAFQSHRLFPHLTVAQNVRFGHRRRQGSGAFVEDEVLQRLELSSLMQRRPSELSGGQKQRVALARVLLSGPGVLLLDEPLSGVEQSLAKSILEFVCGNARAASLPVLLVSHDPALLAEVVSNVLEMKNGILAAQ